MKRITLILFVLLTCKADTASSKLPSEEKKLASRLMTLARASGERPEYKHVLSIARAAIREESTCIPGVLDRKDFVSIAWVESRFNPKAKGKAGEMGTWQVMRSEWNKFKKPLGARDPYDIGTNGEVACRVLQSKYMKYHSYRKTIISFNGWGKKSAYLKKVLKFRKKV